MPITLSISKTFSGFKIPCEILKPETETETPPQFQFQLAVSGFKIFPLKN